MAAIENNEQSVVIDNGSRWIKAGFAGDKTCSFVFQNVIGKAADLEGHGSRVIGKKVNLETDLSLDRPVERGIIVKWDEMEEIWRYLFQEEMKINQMDHKVLISQPLFNPLKNKEKTAQIMFEKFGVNGLFLANQPSLALFCSGRLDGLVLDIGDGVTAAAPVVGGFSKPEAMKTLNISGRDLTEFLLKHLSGEGNIVPTSQLQSIYKIKETNCFVSADIKKETPAATTCELSDGQNVKLGKGAYMCPEALFQPSLMNVQDSGITDMILSSIAETDESIHKKLYNNIILSGASTLFPGLVDRVENELQSKVPESLKPEVQVVAPPERNKSTFLGGSILASLDNFQPMWASKQDYEERGPNVVKQM